MSDKTTLYLSAGTLEKEKPADIPDDAPTHVNGARVHYRWSDAALAGKWVHPTKGVRIDIDDTRLSRWADRINTCLGRGVNLPICKDHKETADNCVGYIYGAKAEGGTLKLLNGYIGNESLRTARKNYLSVGIDPDFRDSLGNSYGEAIRHVALTPVPVIHGQKGFIAASREDAKPDEIETLVPFKEEPMTEASLKKLSEALGVEVVDEESAIELTAATLDELSQEVSTANTRAVNLSAELDEHKAKVIELSAAKVAEPVVIEHKPDARDVENAKLRIELSASAGDIPAWLSKALTAKIDTTPVLLSRDGEGKSTFINDILDLFKGSKLGAKTEEKTGVQMLSRDVPDGEPVKPVSVNPYQDTIAKLTSTAK